ncbi:MAG: fasciclin domain-containing protein [Acidobacteriaceae bacterium]|nr:fasciclin domain-containing protein [Acidobacteriaceae bacterium]MBV8572697.1 fasciclin domain-containing protein [Acidobacteriaceae bacterium]
MASQEGTSQNQMVDDGIDHRLGTRSLDETLAGIPQCSSFYGMIQSSGLDYLLRRSGLHMLLAPTNTAMEKASHEDPEAFLNRHLFSGGMESFDLRRSQKVKSAGGDFFPVTNDDGNLRIAGANLIRTDIACTNGVIHLVDAPISS